MSCTEGYSSTINSVLSVITNACLNNYAKHGQRPVWYVTWHMHMLPSEFQRSSFSCTLKRTTGVLVFEYVHVCLCLCMGTHACVYLDTCVFERACVCGGDGNIRVGVRVHVLVSVCVCVCVCTEFISTVAVSLHVQRAPPTEVVWLFFACLSFLRSVLILLDSVEWTAC